MQLCQETEEFDSKANKQTKKIAKQEGLSIQDKNFQINDKLHKFKYLTFIFLYGKK